MAALSVGFCQSNTTTRDTKYFLPLSVRYSVMADDPRSCRSSRPHTFLFIACC